VSASTAAAPRSTTRRRSSIGGHHTPRSTTRCRSSSVSHPHPPRNIIPRIPPTISPSAAATPFSSSSAFGHYIKYE